MDAFGVDTVFQSCMANLVWLLFNFL